MLKKRTQREDLIFFLQLSYRSSRLRKGTKEDRIEFADFFSLETTPEIESLRTCSDGHITKLVRFFDLITYGNPAFREKYAYSHFNRLFTELVHGTVTVYPYQNEYHGECVLGFHFLLGNEKKEDCMLVFDGGLRQYRLLMELFPLRGKLEQIYLQDMLDDECLCPEEKENATLDIEPLYEYLFEKATCPNEAKYSLEEQMTRFFQIAYNISRQGWFNYVACETRSLSEQNLSNLKISQWMQTESETFQRFLFTFSFRDWDIAAFNLLCCLLADLQQSESKEALLSRMDILSSLIKNLSITH